MALKKSGIGSNKGFSIFDLWDMGIDINDDTTGTTEQPTVWPESAKKAPGKSAFDRFAVGEAPDDFNLAEESEFIKEMKGPNNTINGE